MRLVVGAVFIFSGFAKLDDLWGFIYKINEYLAAWNVDFFNHAIVLTGAFLISAVEFTCGVLLALGVMRRFVPRFMLLMMAFMLPLTIYIAIADPVSDCGCFGEALIISNTASCIKNILITAGIIFLIIYNRRASHPYLPVMQWAVTVTSVIYCALVAIAGYFVQPPVDFRPYPVGQPFIDENNPKQTLTIYSGDEDVTDSVIATSDSLLILTVSDLSAHGMARSAQTNAFALAAAEQNVAMIAIVPGDESEAATWARDVAAEYPVYTADDTQIKELARGTAALVYVTSDTIRWKRNLYSLRSDEPPAGTSLSSYTPIEKSGSLLLISLLYICALIVIWALRFTTNKKF